MEYRRLGSSGCKVSVLGLGTWLTFGGQLHDRMAAALVKRAFDQGVNFVDTADVYDLGGAEEQLAAVLRGIPRKDYVLATKVYFPTGDGPNDRGLSRKHVDESIHASLGRLDTTYVDLYQCHRFDEETPLEETVRALGDLIRQGKVLYWGVSMWTAEQIEAAVDTAAALGVPAPVTNQPCYNLLTRDLEADVLPACRRHGLGTLAFSPLAQGVLTGKYLDGDPPRDSRLADDRRNRFMGRYLEEEATRRVARLAELAADAGTTCARLSLAWVLSRPTVTSVIFGATKHAQVDDNVKAAELKLGDDVLEELDRVFAPARTNGE